MNKLTRRLAILRALMNGKIGLREGLILFLPSGLVIKIASVLTPTTITLLGKDFGVVPDNYHEALDLIDTIIAIDQYAAARLLRADSVVIDAGANIGAFAVFAATLTPRGRVYAFEPGPRAFELLQRNIAFYPNSSCYNVGLGDVSRQQQLYFHSHDTFSATYEDSGRVEVVRSKGAVTNIESEIMTIDEFVSQVNVNAVDFIKVDTEGYEAKVLMGARNTIKNHRPVIVMAAYHHADDASVLPSIVNSIADGYKFGIEDRGDLTLICAP